MLPCRLVANDLRVPASSTCVQGQTVEEKRGRYSLRCYRGSRFAGVVQITARLGGGVQESITDVNHTCLRKLFCDWPTHRRQILDEVRKCVPQGVPPFGRTAST